MVKQEMETCRSIGRFLYYVRPDISVDRGILLNQKGYLCNSFNHI